MKKQETEMQYVSRYHDIMIFFRKHPEIELTLKRPDDACKTVFYAPDINEPGEYATNTTT